MGTNLLVEAESTAAVATYIRGLQATDLSFSTIQKYRKCLTAFVTWLEGQPFTEQLAKDFLGSLRRQGFAIATVRIYYHSLKPFLLTQGVNLKAKFKKRRRLPHYHSVDQVKAILAAAEQRSDAWAKNAQRDSLIISLFAYTGIRRAELLSLKRGDLDFINKNIKVHGKGDNDRAIPMAPAVIPPLQDYTDALEPRDLLFQIKANRVFRIIALYAHRAGVTDFSPHSFRHYFATQLVEQGVALNIIKELLGHADISTTAIYLDVLPKHLESAVLALPDLRRKDES